MANHSTPRGTRLRLADIAQQAGVSVATVSNVINNKGRMSKETVERVMRIVAEHGGVGIRMDAIQPGKIVFGSADPLILIEHSFLHMRVQEGIQAALNGKGWTVSMEAFSSPEDFRNRAGEYSAAVMVGFPDDPDAWSKEAPIPVVWALRSTCRTADVVQEDNREIARLVAEYVLERGHKIVGYINDRHLETLTEREWHLKSFLRREGGKLISAAGENLFAGGPDGMSIDREQMGRLLKKLLEDTKEVPTALFVPGDRLCVTVYSLLGEMGVKPQTDLTVISCNNEKPFLTTMEPRPVTVGMNAEAIGRRAAETALWRISHMNEPFVRLLVMPELVLPPK